AKSRRQFDNKYEGYNIPYIFERPHEFSILGQWMKSRKINLSFSWQWGSGVATPLVPGKYEIYNRLDYFEEIIVVPPDEIELLILPAYHRLDVSASFKMKKRRSEHVLKFSLLNVYDVENISFAKVEYNDDLNSIRFVGGLPIIPSLAYHISFQ
ncbi:MAG: hypothetical protein HKN76_23040, partial [Saprospiraceae bacterium]|nr:hypothetical protein [Saprospiraceae bacterium]